MLIGYPCLPDLCCATVAVACVSTRRSHCLATPLIFPITESGVALSPRSAACDSAE